MRRAERFLLLGAILVVLFIAWTARDVEAVEPIEWPCLGPGWTAGDVYAPPDELSIVPSAPPCPVETYDPRPSGDVAGEELSIDSSDVAGPDLPELTLPPTDAER